MLRHPLAATPSSPPPYQLMTVVMVEVVASEVVVIAPVAAVKTPVAAVKAPVAAMKTPVAVLLVTEVPEA